MIRKIVRDADGEVVVESTLTDSQVPPAYAELAHTVAVDHFVVHHVDGGSVEYRRGPEVDEDELDLTPEALVLSPEEILRETGATTVSGDGPADEAIARFRGALREYQTIERARAAGTPRPSTPILDGYEEEQRERRVTP